MNAIPLTEDTVREYRAYDIRNKIMVYDALKLTETHRLVTVNEQHFNSPFSFFDGCKWMQYTGRKDEKSTKIFESDILTDELEHLGEVVYDNEAGAFMVKWNDGDTTYLNDAAHLELEVKGNIYDDPDMIK